MKQDQQMNIRPSRPKPTAQFSNQRSYREEGSQKNRNCAREIRDQPSVRPSRPNAEKIARAVAPILRGATPKRINAIDEIIRLSGKRPDHWTKPNFGDFDYWLAYKAGWISAEELTCDQTNYETKRQRALETSHRFSQERFTWIETPKYEQPVDNGEYIPSINMKLIRDQNLTDSSRRIACFVLRHAYQDNREGRFVAMTVSFIMKGLQLSRRTVQRSLTLLETRGYFRCEVATGNTTKMCIGLVIHLMQSLFPKHHRDKWPQKRRKSEASSMPQKKIQIYKSILNAKAKVSRLSWALRCMNAVARRAEWARQKDHEQIPACRGFKTLRAGVLNPRLRTLLCGGANTA